MEIAFVLRGIEDRVRVSSERPELVGTGPQAAALRYPSWRFINGFLEA